MKIRRTNAGVPAVTLATLCALLAACESQPRAGGEPASRVDVQVTPPAARTAQAPPPEPEPAEVRIENTDTGAVMGSQPAPARTEPARQAPPPAVSAQPPQQWWLMTPEPEPGRIRIVAKGGGDTLPAARQAAVDAGREQLARLRGSPPDELEFEKTQAFPRAGGVYEAFVLISCER